LNTIILLCLAAFCVASSDAPSNVECKTMNPFLDKLADDDDFEDIVRSHPIQSSDACQWEWTTFKSCCYAAKLREYEQSDRRKVFKGVNSTLNILHRYINSTRQLIDINFKEIATANPTANKTPQPSKLCPKSSIGLKAQPINPALNTKLEYLREAISSIENKNNDYQADTMACWTEMANIRARSLCSICSGRSITFFEKNKLLISGETCSSLLNKCVGSFSVLIKFFIGMGELALRLKEDIKDITLTEVMKKFIDSLLEMTENIRSSKIHKTLFAYVESAFTGIRSLQLASDLCSELISIKQSPFITKIPHIIEEENLEILDNVISEIKKDPLWFYNVFANVGQIMKITPEELKDYKKVREYRTSERIKKEKLSKENKIREKEKKKLEESKRKRSKRKRSKRKRSKRKRSKRKRSKRKRKQKN